MEQQYYEISSNFTPIFNIALALLKGRGCEEKSVTGGQVPVTFKFPQSVVIVVLF